MKYLFIHHTAVSYNQNPDQFNQTNEYHRTQFNMLSSLNLWGGYTKEISKNGTVRRFRTDGEEQAAQIAYNKDSISICLDGNFDIEMPTIEQTNALKKEIADYQIKYPGIIVKGHRYVATTKIQGNPIKNVSMFETIDGFQPYKFCPGKLLSDQWIKDLTKNNDVKGRILELLSQLTEAIKSL